MESKECGNEENKETSDTKKGTDLVTVQIWRSHNIKFLVLTTNHEYLCLGNADDPIKLAEAESLARLAQLIEINGNF